jgi:alpha-beta hydrolase superfamily lysophospholipase
MRIVHGQAPAAGGVHDGLAWGRFDPAQAPLGVVVILPGAGSVKESHHDFARCCTSAGLAAMTFDARGHGASEGALGAGAIDDVARMAVLARAQLGDESLPVVLRGSSMGGYLAIVAARACDAAAVVSICPAPGELLMKMLELDEPRFRADVPALTALLAANDLHDAAAALTVPLLLLHARGDESVPVEGSQELARVAADCRYIEMPGGHHRSIQHDAELQGVATRFIRRALG